MKVLLVTDEFFSWGYHGGYGYFTRKLGRELVKSGVDVECWVHKISSEQKPVGEFEEIDGVQVKTLPRNKIGKYWKNKSLYKTDADVIHSECGRLDTFLVFKRNPDVPKVVTVQDLRSKKDWEKIGESQTKNILWDWWVTKKYRQALQMANIVSCQANHLKRKIRELLGYRKEIVLLPNFCDPPSKQVAKSDRAKALFLGRLDPIKNPELCFKLAKELPDVDFYVLGKAHDRNRDSLLKKTYGEIGNLHLLGHNSGEIKEKLLCKSWFLVNTSLYECLPVSFLEAMSHKCALLSTRNPDGYTAMFGCHCQQTVSSLRDGFVSLVEDGWREKAERGYRHYMENHTTERGVKNHLELYENLIR